MHLSTSPFSNICQQSVVCNITANVAIKSTGFAEIHGKWPCMQMLLAADVVAGLQLFCIVKLGHMGAMDNMKDILSSTQF